MKELLIDDWFGLVLLITTLITIAASIICLIIEKYIIKRKLFLCDSLRLPCQSDEQSVEMKIPRISITSETPIQSLPPHYTYNGRRHSRSPNEILNHINGSYANDGTDSKSIDRRVETIENDITYIKKMLQKLVQKETPKQAKREINNLILKSKDLSGALM